MRITSPDPKKKTVVDYEFTFAGGTQLPVTIDAEAGDTVSYEHAPVAVVINLVAKPSIVNPAVMMDAEEITVYQAHLLAVSKRVREVTELTEEQKVEWNNFLNTLEASGKPN